MCTKHSFIKKEPKLLRECAFNTIPQEEGLQPPVDLICIPVSFQPCFGSGSGWVTLKNSGYTMGVFIAATHLLIGDSSPRLAYALPSINATGI